MKLGPNAGKDWRQEEKGVTEDEMVGWHHWLNGHELKQTLGASEGQGSLACCSSWGCQESDIATEQQNEIRVHYSSETQVSLETTSTEFLIL